MKITYYKIKYKPYGEFVGIVMGVKKCVGDHQAYSLKTPVNPTPDMLRAYACGMVDRQGVFIYSLRPHRITDKELEDFEIVKFEKEEKERKKYTYKNKIDHEK